VFRHRELAQKISGLTEDIEELKSEKALLLNQFNCADAHDITEVKQCIASMESSLETLNQQEKKYIAELDEALAQYTELRQQAADMDTKELEAACWAVRLDKERQAVQQLQTGYGKQYDPHSMHQSQEDVAVLLSEAQQRRSVRQQLRKRQQAQTHIPQKRQSQEQER